MQPPQVNVFRANVVMGRHGEKRQARLQRRFRVAGKQRKLARDAVRTKRTEKFELLVARGFRAPVGEIDDLALRMSLDGGVRRLD